MSRTKAKKYSKGQGTQYWPRSKVLRKLQLTLKQFRKLCVLKGIYPREPRSRTKAQRGAGGIKVLYLVKDIRFAMHDPIIWTLRKQFTVRRKLKRATVQKNEEKIQKLEKQDPVFHLDHIIKERYPTFLDALNDLDDCLTMVYLFSALPKMSRTNNKNIDMCRRLIVEFMQAVIAMKALRKVFISIKGYYFQAEIRGQTVTWIIPHVLGIECEPTEVDIGLMDNFIQFYTILLGFVNFRLYHILNLHYPPAISLPTELTNENKKEYIDERIASLNIPLLRASEIGTEEESNFNDFKKDEIDDTLSAACKEEEKVEKLKVLFKGMKIFLNREVPREPLVFILRCFGAEVSWDELSFIGSTFQESDETITHQIVDRPSINNQYISRYYVQPQWVFDCVNAREIVPVASYFIGSKLPPHLSPFADNSHRKKIYVPSEAMEPSKIKEYSNEDEEGESDYSEKDEEFFEGYELDEEHESKNDQQLDGNSEDEDEEEDEEEEEDNDNGDDATTELLKRQKEMTKRMKVEPGKAVPRIDDKEQKQREYEEFKLKEKMIQRKHKRLYRILVKGNANEQKDIAVLKKKKALLVQKEKERKKQQKT